VLQVSSVYGIGGATSSYYHFGVLKTLFDAKLLPNILSGTSGGAYLHWPRVVTVIACASLVLLVIVVPVVVVAAAVSSLHVSV